jgi:hypothetical protein
VWEGEYGANTVHTCMKMEKCETVPGMGGGGRLSIPGRKILQRNVPSSYLPRAPTPNIFRSKRWCRKTHYTTLLTFVFKFFS